MKKQKMMKLNKLQENVRRNMVQNNLELLDVLATGHNLIQCIKHKQYGRLDKKTTQFIGSFNNLIEELNKIDTPIEDE